MKTSTSVRVQMSQGPRLRTSFRFYLIMFSLQMTSLSYFRLVHQWITIQNSVITKETKVPNSLFKAKQVISVGI